MSFIDALISLRPSVGFNILVAAFLALLAILLIWQGDRTIILRMAHHRALWRWSLRICLALILCVFGALGAIVLAGPLAVVLYLVTFAAICLGMVLQAKRQPRLSITESDAPKFDNAEVFAAAVELQLQATDIEVGLFRNGISPLEKRITTLGKKTTRKLR